MSTSPITDKEIIAAARPGESWADVRQRLMKEVQQRTEARHWSVALPHWRVTMSNALTRAGHGLTLSEKRIVSAAAAKLDSRTGCEIARTKLTAREYADLFEISLDAAYTQLWEGAQNLMKRKITFYEPAFMRNGKAVSETITTMQWLGQATYHMGEGWIELHWWPPLMTHLVGLRRQFTSYRLGQAAALRGCSWRLMELLQRFRKTGWAEYSIEDFCISIDATEKQRADFAAIRRQFIEPAVNELKESGWLIAWRPIRAGRKVKAIHFTFQPSVDGPVDVAAKNAE